VSVWKAGDTVVLREMWHDRVWTAMPAIVVEDEPGQRILFIPAGTNWKYAVDQGGRELRLYRDDWIMADSSAKGSVLSFSWPDRSHAVLAMWDARWNFLRWYVNIETQLRRTAMGLDYVDHCLDVVMAPDRSTWQWKDEDELEEAVRLGLFTAREAEAFRAEGELAVERLVRSVPPFDRHWPSWRPHPAWPVPELPRGWDHPNG
jgi:predicted RNA-binding protein associated with RNAse of E/G family